MRPMIAATAESGGGGSGLTRLNTQCAIEYAHRSGKKRAMDTRAAQLVRLDLRLRFAHARRRLEAAGSKATQRINLTLTKAHGRLDPLPAHLTQLSPLKI